MFTQFYYLIFKVNIQNPRCRDIWSVDISEGVLRLTVNLQSKSPAEMSSLNGLPSNKFPSGHFSWC